MIRPGTPATTAWSRTSWVTTQLPPMQTWLPIFTLPMIFAPGPMYTLSPTVGKPFRFLRGERQNDPRRKVAVLADHGVAIDENAAEVADIQAAANLRRVDNIDAVLHLVACRFSLAKG